MSDQNQPIPETLTWQASSHLRHARSPRWYIGFGIVSIGLLVFAIFDHSILTILTFVLIIAAIYSLAIQPPQEITCRITKTGITVGEVVYAYKTIKYFWILYNPPEIKTLNFETTAYINNQVVVQLGGQDPLEVKVVLSQYLLEDLNREESMSDLLARRLKI